MKRSKRYTEVAKMIEHLKEYSPEEGVKILKEAAKARFDETVDIAMRLGVDPRHADQMVRGTVSLPNGTGKTVRILVLTKGENVDKAKSAGADYAGFEEFIEQIQKGWIEFDVVVASPDVMSLVGRLGKILGTRGLMPNPKSGTLTPNPERAVKELSAGKRLIKTERKAPLMHVNVGKVSMDSKDIQENIQAVAKAFKNKVVKMSLSASMSPGVKVDIETI